MMRVQQGRAHRHRARAWSMEALEDRRLLTQYAFPSDPNLSLIDFETPAANVAESVGEVAFTVVRSGDVSGAASVRVETRALTAVAGYDYVPLDTTLTFAPGQARTTFRVKILDDRIAEPIFKGFRVQLSDAKGAYSVGAQRSREVSIRDDEPASQSPLTFHAFAGAGLWTHNDVEGWRKINDATPEAIVPALDRGVVLDFGAAGLWAFDELRGYRKLNDVDPRAILPSRLTGELLIDFGHGGLWTWGEREGYRKINDAVPDAMAGDGASVALMNFGARGLWQWSEYAGWSKVRDRGPDSMVDADNSTVYLDYGADGLWSWNGSPTDVRKLADGDPEAIAPTREGLYVSFKGAGLSVLRQGVWAKAHDLAPRAIVAPGGDNGYPLAGPPPVIVMDFGAAGLWQRTAGGWERINAAGPANIVIEGSQDLLLNYGAAGLWRWSPQSGYAKLRDVAPTASTVSWSSALFRGTDRDRLPI